MGIWQPLESQGDFHFLLGPLAYPSAGDPGLVPWPPFIEACCMLDTLLSSLCA